MYFSEILQSKKLVLQNCVVLLLFSIFSFQTAAQNAGEQSSAVSKTWVADNGDGTYKNPILHADYSDPDAVRVGDDFYMTASSFNVAPGLPILHSKDLVNWRLINYVFAKQPPFNVFDKTQHGGGVWAPSIRYHNGEFYIFYPDPDFGIYMTKTKNPAGEWSEPLLIKEAKGWIDPAPLWDEDGNAYLVFAFAGSRAGIKSVLVVSRMSHDGTKLLGDPVMVFDGHEKHPTVEGPKFYKRNGYYYIFAPAGGVATGWQLVLRSKNIFGPYEEKISLSQGKTSINGPHQGAWVTTQTGEDWFLHFQDKGVYGRIVHLQPMKWVNDFPVMGVDADGDGTGEPVLKYKKPNVGKTYPIVTPPESEEFNLPQLGLQWQWHANPQTTWSFLYPHKGVLQMYSVQQPENLKNLWDVPNLLLQKFPADKFTATTKVTLTPRFEGEKFGLIVMGLDYAHLSVTNRQGKLFVSQAFANNADKGTKETETAPVELKEKTFYLRVKVENDAMCQFSYSTDGKTFTRVGTPFKAREGKWIGAKMGLFFIRNGKFNDAGSAEIDWFRIE
ncbi:MAG: glycoside hydrolase 43 family protein [Acidobacteriota bacterium]|nr:glycoside hydrolase 43 family protein [Acidobacteriota bacterium]